MKINTKLILMLSMFVIPASAIAQSPTVGTSGIRIIHEVVGKDNNKLAPFNSFRKGTALGLLVRSPASIIKIDERASKLDSFTDSKGTNLLVKEEGSFQNIGFGALPRVSEDGKAGLIEISGGGVPVKGADSIKAKGTLVVMTASKKKAVKSQPISLTKETKFKVGDIDLKIDKVGKPNFGDSAVEVGFETSNKAITTVASVKFFDASGKEIESQGAGSSSMGFGNKYTYGRNFGLKKEVSGKVVVQFEVWTDLKEQKVPFSISAGVGG